MDTIQKYRQKQSQWQRKMSILQRQEPKTPEIEIVNKRKRYKYRYILSSDNFTLFLKVRHGWSNIRTYDIGYFISLIQDRINYRQWNVIPEHEQLTPLNRIKLRTWCKGLGLVNENGEVLEGIYQQGE